MRAISPPRIDRIRRPFGFSRARSTGGTPLRRAEEDSTVDDASRMIHDAQDGQSGDALAAAAFPDDAQHLSGGEVEADAVHRPYDSLPSEEMGLQVPELGGVPGGVHVLGREQTADIRIEPDESQVHDQQAEQEVGHADAGEAEQGEQVVSRGILTNGRVDTHGQSHGPGEQDGGQRRSEMISETGWPRIQETPRSPRSNRPIQIR